MGPRASDEADDEVTITRTLKGLGPLTNACPACHVGRERPVIEADLAASFGIALVFARGAEAARKSLCRRHLSWVDLLRNEITGGDATSSRPLPPR